MRRIKSKTASSARVCIRMRRTIEKACGGGGGGERLVCCEGARERICCSRRRRRRSRTYVRSRAVARGGAGNIARRLRVYERAQASAATRRSTKTARAPFNGDGGDDGGGDGDDHGGGDGNGDGAGGDGNGDGGGGDGNGDGDEEQTTDDG